VNKQAVTIAITPVHF